LALLGHAVHDKPPEPQYPGWHLQDCIPNESTLVLALMGVGQARQQGGDAHDAVTLV